MRGTSPALKILRPQTRSDCINGPRPCPWAGCRYNLYLDVNEDNGSIKFNFPDIAPEDMNPSCALDVATAEDGATLDEVGSYMNLSRERIRQIEVRVMEVLKKLVKRITNDKARKD